MEFLIWAKMSFESEMGTAATQMRNPQMDYVSFTIQKEHAKERKHDVLSDSIVAARQRSYRLVPQTIH
jgi:hypothetical protein